jgi:hypothetical protein
VRITVAPPPLAGAADRLAVPTLPYPEATPQLQAPAGAALPLSLRLIVVTAFLPEGLSFFIAGLRLTLARLILVLLTPYLVIRIGRRLASGRYRFVAADSLVLAAGFWMFLAPAQMDGLTVALRHTGPIAVEFCGAYLAARFLLREHEDALALVNLLCLTIAVVAMLGLLDSLSGTHVIRGLVTSMTGYTLDVWQRPIELRFGIVRAMGPLEHPILYALACGIGLLLATGVWTSARWFTILACSLGVLFSFSAGPTEGVVLGMALLLYYRLLGAIEGRTFALGSLVVTVSVTFFFASGHPFGFIVSHFTFDQQAGWFRLYAWHLAGIAALQSPWFGIGFTAWFGNIQNPDITVSVDALWLVLAMMFGIPGSLLVGSVVLGSMLPGGNGPKATLSLREAQLASTLSIVLLVIVLVGFTVDLWGTDWLLCGLLAGARAHLSELGRGPNSAAGD